MVSIINITIGTYLKNYYELSNNYYTILLYQYNVLLVVDKFY